MLDATPTNCHIAKDRQDLGYNFSNVKIAAAPHAVARHTTSNANHSCDGLR